MRGLAHYCGPEAFTAMQALAPLVKATLRATSRGGAQRVREILERTRKDLEKL